MNRKKEIPGEQFKSVEAFYLTQFSKALLKESKEIDTLKQKCQLLSRKIKKAYSDGYKQGYQEGREEVWDISPAKLIK